MKKLILLVLFAMISLSPLTAATGDAVTSSDTSAMIAKDSNECQGNIKIIEINPQEIQDSINSLVVKLTEVQQQSNTHFLILCAVSALLIVGLLICLLLLLRKTGTSRQVAGGSHELESIKRRLIKGFDDMLVETSRIQKEIGRQSSQIEKINTLLPSVEKPASMQPDKAMTISEVKKNCYARPHTNSLKECDVRDASYKLEVNGNSAQYVFCGKVEKAIANKDAVLVPYCEIVAKVDAADKIITLEQGKLSLKSAGEWIVVSKAKIELKK